MKQEWDAPLAPLTTMRVGGPAARLVTVESTDELVDVVCEVDDADEPLLLLSGGSNLVIADDGFSGTAVRIATCGVQVESEDLGGRRVSVRVAAGEPWDDFVAHAREQGWAGIEALSGIPGLTGATPVQNVGAYGQEVAQTIAQVRVLDRHTQQVHAFANADCAFTYRHSIFKESARYIVLDVLFQLRLATLSQPIAYAALGDGLGVAIGDRVPLGDAREAVLQQRRSRGMVLDADDHDTWSCGSFFTNPIMDQTSFEIFRRRASERLGSDGPVPPAFPVDDGRIKTIAAWLIDKTGFTKGYGMPGPAALSTRHSLALTNRGDAKAADIVALARQVRDGVEAAFGVRLVNEPVFVGHQL